VSNKTRKRGRTIPEPLLYELGEYSGKGKRGARLGRGGGRRARVNGWKLGRTKS